MKDVIVLYAFFALMVLNLLGSFIYLAGLNQVRNGVRKALRLEKRQ